jgi:hypothetical protein
MPPNDRSRWQGPVSGEPDVWHTSDDMKAHFKDKTNGRDPECFIQV